MVVHDHAEKETVFANNKVVLGEALYANSKTTGRTQTKEDKTIIVVDSILKGIQHWEFNQKLKNGCNSKDLWHLKNGRLKFSKKSSGWLPKH